MKPAHKKTCASNGDYDVTKCDCNHAIHIAELKRRPAPAPQKPRKKKISVNKLVMDWMRAKGWEIGLVEQTIPHTFIKRDLFNFVDMIAVNGRRIIGLQVTSNSGGNLSNRVTKAKAQDAFGKFVTSCALYFVGVNIRDDGTVRYRIIEVNENGQIELDEIPR